MRMPVATAFGLLAPRRDGRDDGTSSSPAAIDLETQSCERRARSVEQPFPAPHRSAINILLFCDMYVIVKQ
jgi:hypothetical protein